MFPLARDTMCRDVARLLPPRNLLAHDPDQFSAIIDRIFKRELPLGSARTRNVPDRTTSPPDNGIQNSIFTIQ